jgi:hypothetical protein
LEEMMDKGIHALRRGIRMGSQIGFAIEERVRAHTACAAFFEKVNHERVKHERVNQWISGRAGLRVTAEIVIGVE